MSEMQNAMTVAAMRAGDARQNTRLAIVDAYDPETFSVKVKLQPSGVLTGWLPVASCFVGNGWGMFAAPTIGDMVQVDCQEGDIDAGMVTGAIFNDIDRPLAVPSGDFWLVHRSGSMLKFHGDGVIEMTAATELRTAATVWNHTGPVNVDGLVTVNGAIRATGEITDFYLTQPYSMAGFRARYNLHTHFENGAGSQTNVTSQQA